MKKQFCIKGAAFVSLAVLASLVAAQEKYQGDVYWTSQGNNGFPFGDDPQFGRFVDGNMVSFGANEIDWANCDIFLDSRYTGQGVNYITGPGSDMTIKSLTINDNWDGKDHGGGTKDPYVWFGQSIGDAVSTLAISGDYTIKSSQQYSGSAQTFSINAQNVIVSIPTNEEWGSDRTRTAGFIGMAELYVRNNFEVQKADWVHTYDTANVYVGADMILKNMTGGFGGERTGRKNGDGEGEIVGGFTIVGNFIADGLQMVNTYNAGFLKVGKNFELSNTRDISNMFNMGYVEIGGSFIAENAAPMITNTGYMKIGGDLVLNTGASLRESFYSGVNGGAASADNPDTYIGGKFVSNNGYHETQWVSAKDGGRRFTSSAGMKGTGGTLAFAWDDSATGTLEKTFVLRNTDTNDLSTSFMYWGDLSKKSDVRLNFIMNGSGKQIVRAISGSGDNGWTWNGSVKVNSGQFLLNTSSARDSIIDVEVAGGARFGAAGAFYSENFDPLNEAGGLADVRNLSVSNNGGLIVYADRYGNSSINVGGLITVGDSLNIFVEGSVAEGDELVSILEWAYTYEAENKAALEGLFADGRVNLFVNGVSHAIESWMVGNTSLGLVVGVVPEPAAVAAALGAMALGLAAWRRRK